MEDIKYGAWLWTVTPLNYYLARNPNNLAIYKPKETEEDNMEELKPCPFCGSDVEIVSADEITGAEHPFDKGADISFWFKCYGCDTDIFHDEPYANIDELLQRSIKWWNRRAE